MFSPLQKRFQRQNNENAFQTPVKQTLKLQNAFSHDFNVESPSITLQQHELPDLNITWRTEVFVGEVSGQETLQFQQYHGLSTPEIKRRLFLSEKVESIVKLQSWWKAKRQQRQYQQLTQATRVIQRHYRSKLPKLPKIQSFMQPIEFIHFQHSYPEPTIVESVIETHLPTQNDAMDLKSTFTSTIEPIVQLTPPTLESTESSSQMAADQHLLEMMAKLAEIKKQKQILEEQIALAKGKTSKSVAIQTRPLEPRLKRARKVQNVIPTPVEPQIDRKKEKAELLELEKITQRNTATNSGYGVILQITPISLPQRPPSPTGILKQKMEDRPEDWDFKARIDEKPSPGKRIRWTKKSPVKFTSTKPCLKSSKNEDGPELPRDNIVVIQRFEYVDEADFLYYNPPPPTKKPKRK